MVFWDEEKRQQCTELYELIAEGKTLGEARELVDVSHSVASRWVNNPSKYDPYLDEIAITRALAGEKNVYESLTVWERRAFLQHLIAEREALFDWEWSERYSKLRKQLDISLDTFTKALSRAGA